MPGSTQECLGFSGRRGAPEIQGRDAGQRCARRRVLRYMGVCVEELVRVSEEKVLGLLDVSGLFGRGRFIAGISRRLPPSFLISGGSWDGTPG